ncbi:hypothetical protein JJB09_00110 [Rhizobium sp. KVB221]|uniref:Antitoxin FitA-like ribbon-helix-helix domain-containing protein n=2 Tax=Rhizobium setariae TaxID=2801340 RepID=A0A937CM06_9HYPH|nr:hypothetical protein [Rhizobium setariae]
MSQTLRVENVDDEIVKKLSDRAVRHGRTIEAEHRAILMQALDAKLSFEELAGKMREMLEGRHHTQSEILMLEGRDDR